MEQFVAIRDIAPARWLLPLATLAALALGLLAWSGDADARFMSGWGFAGEVDSIGFADAVPDALSPAAAQPTYRGGSLGGLFNRGDPIGGFAAGFLGAGVIGLLFGHGVVGELNGAASVLGLLFQLALILTLARLIWTWWRDDKADPFATLSPRQLADAYGHSRNEPPPEIESEAAPGAAGDNAAAKTDQPA